jgi:phosphoglycolate phosphatase-like HAD superfamily hydrolase
MDFEESPNGALAPDGTSLKDRVLMIGDSIYDIRCCDNAGIGSMLVTWTEALKITQEGDVNTAVHGNGEEVHPDFILADADEFEKILADRM